MWYRSSIQMLECLRGTALERWVFFVSQSSSDGRHVRHTVCLAQSTECFGSHAAHFWVIILQYGSNKRLSVRLFKSSNVTQRFASSETDKLVAVVQGHTEQCS